MRSVDAFTLEPTDEDTEKVFRLSDKVFIGAAGNAAVGEFVVGSLTDASKKDDNNGLVEFFKHETKLAIKNVVKQIPNDYPISSNASFILAGINKFDEVEVYRILLREKVISIEQTEIVPGKTSFTALLPNGMEFEECGAIFASCHFQKYGTLDGTPDSCQHSIRETIRIVSRKNSLVGPDSLVLQYCKHH